MESYRVAGCLLATAAFLGAVGPATAQQVEVAPFAGVQFGGSFESPAAGAYAIGTGPVFGGTVDIAIAPSWRVELLYSRQATELSNPLQAARFDLKVERYMVGIEEEKGDRARFFGVFLLGVTRFVPGFGGYDSDERFTLGLSLGVKTSLSRRLGLRAEARGFFVNVSSYGATVCSNGTCLFHLNASGLWQGDVTAGVTLAF